MVSADARVSNRQALRSERSTEALLDAAADLIADGGLASMTFAAIGERAGYSRGLVTARFGSKSGLVEALIRRVWSALRDAGIVPLAAGVDGLASVMGLIDGIHQQAMSNHRDMRAMNALIFEALSAGDELEERMAAFNDAMRAEIAAALRRGVEDGSVGATVEPESAAVVVTSALVGIAYQWLLHADEFDLGAAYDALRRDVRAAMAAR